MFFSLTLSGVVFYIAYKFIKKNPALLVDQKTGKLRHAMLTPFTVALGVTFLLFLFLRYNSFDENVRIMIGQDGGLTFANSGTRVTFGSHSYPRYRAGRTALRPRSFAERQSRMRLRNQQRARYTTSSPYSAKTTIPTTPPPPTADSSPSIPKPQPQPQESSSSSSFSAYTLPSLDNINLNPAETGSDNSNAFSSFSYSNA